MTEQHWERHREGKERERERERSRKGGLQKDEDTSTHIRRHSWGSSACRLRKRLLEEHRSDASSNNTLMACRIGVRQTWQVALLPYLTHSVHHSLAPLLTPPTRDTAGPQFIWLVSLVTWKTVLTWRLTAQRLSLFQFAVSRMHQLCLNEEQPWFALRLLNAYKMYAVVEFSWTILAGTE